MLTPFHTLVGIIAGIVFGGCGMAYFAMFTLRVMCDSAAGRGFFGGKVFRDHSRNFVIHVVAESLCYQWFSADDMRRAMDIGEAHDAKQRATIDPS